MFFFPPSPANRLASLASPFPPCCCSPRRGSPLCHHEWWHCWRTHTHAERERRTLARKADFCQERDSSRVLSSPSAVDPQSSLRKRVGWGDTGCLSGRTSDARLSQTHIKSAFLWNPYLCLIHAQWCLISEFSNTVMAATRSRIVP